MGKANAWQPDPRSARLPRVDPPLAGKPAARSEHRQGPCAFEGNPGTAADERQRHDLAQQLAPVQEGEMEGGVDRLAVAFDHEAHEPRIAAESPRLVHDSQPDGGAVEQVLDDAHSMRTME